MHTHNILGAADIVISPLSTILIEALCHGKESYYQKKKMKASYLKLEGASLFPGGN